MKGVKHPNGYLEQSSHGVSGQIYSNFWCKLSLTHDPEEGLFAEKEGKKVYARQLSSPTYLLATDSVVSEGLYFC